MIVMRTQTEPKLDSFVGMIQECFCLIIQNHNFFLLGNLIFLHIANDSFPNKLFPSLQVSQNLLISTLSCQE